ncbi:hypothetical protein U1Q18_008883 [Sarracenia purpurea var. burkii]
MRNKVISLAPVSIEDEDGKNQSTESESKTGNKSAEKGRIDKIGMKAITEEEKLESRVYKNEAGGDGDENEAEVEGDGDSCTEVESSEIGDDPGDGNPEFSETEDGEKLKQNSASSGEKQRYSNHAHQVLDKMPKTATMTKTKGNFSVSFSDSFLSCSQSSFVNVVDNLAPGKCSVDEINQPSSEVEDMYLENCRLLDECEISEVELALKRFRIQYPDAVRESSVKGLLRGVAAHHAGCLPLWKSFIEELFQRGLVKVVFATETLAAGINMPAMTAVIASLSKRNESERV